MLVELKIVKMNGNVQIFKVELPQIKPSLGIPKTLKMEYGVESEECESNINYERVPASKMECVTRPSLDRWIKEVKNTATSMTESDILNMYSDFVVSCILINIDLTCMLIKNLNMYTDNF